MTTSESQAPQDSAGPQLSQRQINRALIGVMTGLLLSALDQTVVSTALPSIVSDVGGLENLAWVITAYLLTSMASTPVWGKVSDQFGRRIVFIVATSVFIVGSALCGIAQEITQLIAARAVQGLGAGALYALALSVIADVVPSRDRGRYQGMVAGVFGIATLAGPLVGGGLVDAIGWRWIFLINVPLGLLSLFVTASALRIPMERRSHTVDYLGATLVIAATTPLLLYLSWAGGERGWADPLSLGLVAASVVLTLALVLVERRAAEPVVPMVLFRLRLFSLGSAYSLIAGLALFTGVVFLPVYFQAVKGLSPFVAGLAVVPTMIGVGFGSIYAGNRMSATGRFRIFPVLGAALLVVTLLPLGFIDADTPSWLIILLGLVFGVGAGFALQPIITAVQGVVDPADIGTATAAISFFQRLGSAVGVALLGAVLNSRFVALLSDASGSTGGAPDEESLGSVESIRNLAQPQRDLVVGAYGEALATVFLTVVPFAVLALVLGLLMPETPPAEATEEDATAEQPVAGEEQR
ncbi:MDR family MFS transporter [Streptomyces sp. NBRC 110035]|uniref:MDR family MFS transporter n=1 Tax=Streptomyces sp. NBRC 110035 TaxID=1547867 RepID=UPI0005A7CAFE|nr:MDR family MFS transporter [Streptomyces sp. NBRC 110035]